MEVIEFEKMSSDDIYELLEEIPAPSALLSELQSLLGQNEVSPDKVESLVQQDPVIAADVIRYSNSASFGCREKAASLNDAIAIIGYAKLNRFVSAKAFKRLATMPLDMYGLSADEFYVKSVAAAIAMDEISADETDIGGINYTIGLMHGMGEALINQYLVNANHSSDSLNFAETPFRRLSMLEKSVIGMDQAQVAAIALRKWNFAERVVQPIECQFEPMKCRENMEKANALNASRYVARTLLDEHRGILSPSKAMYQLSFQNKTLIAVYETVKEEIARYNEIAV